MLIWCVHDIVPGPARQPWEISDRTLERAISAHLARGYEFVPTDSARWYEPGTILLSVDDGTGGAARWLSGRALDFGLSAAYFAVTGWLDQPPPRSPEHAYRTLASWDDVARLQDVGHLIGSHSQSHVRLAGEPDGRIWQELTSSRERLRAVTGSPVAHFAAPYGSLSPRVMALAGQAGYETVSSTEPGGNLGTGGRLPRVLKRLVLRSDRPALGLPDATRSDRGATT
ncbi:MAG TPA: polysaccharide deacetylase family protein [Streptosporangiaceae bacterium]